GDGAADLLLGVDEPLDRTVRQIALADEANSLQHHGDAGLHVEDAGAARDVALHAEGLALDGPKRPDRVDVGHDQQGLFVGAARAAPAGYGQVAVLALGVYLHLRTERPALLLEVGGQHVDRRLVGAWGLTADHLAHGREQVLAPLVHRLDQRHCPSSPLTDPVPT